MKRVLIWLGGIFLVFGGGLILLGIWTWPPGGLFFALPFFFLIPGVPMAVVGGALLLIGRLLPVRQDDTQDE